MTYQKYLLTMDMKTGDRGGVEFEYASLMRRFAGVIIDNITLVLSLVLMYLLVVISPGTLGILWMATWFLFVLFYIFVLEGIWTNQTVGKRAMRMRVVREDGSPATVRDSVLRNVVGVIGQAFGVPGLLVGMFAIWQSDQNQRLGDSFADTVVVEVSNPSE